jgi:hypothetical protein
VYSVVTVILCIDFFTLFTFLCRLLSSPLLSLLSLLNHSKKGTFVGSEESTLAHLNFS